MKRLASTLGLVLGLVISVGCSATKAGGAGGGDPGSGGSGAQGGAGGTGGFDPAAIVGIAIEPADAVITVLNGSLPSPLDFEVVGVTMGGEHVPFASEGTWTYDRPDAGQVNPEGLFTASGLLGAKGTLKFESGELAATTSVTVRLHVSADPEGLKATTQPAFDAASTADPLLQFVYPYQGTVYPRGLPGPTLQLVGGGNSNVYYVHVDTEVFELEAWQTLAPKARWDWPLTPDAWRALTDSTAGNLEIQVQRWDGATAYLPEKVTLDIAAANLAGTITYHELNPPQNGAATVRMEPGKSAPQVFLQGNCVGCHSVSKDGSRVAASTQGGSSPWSSYDNATGQELFSSGESSGFQAISPNGSHVLWGHWRTGAWDYASDGYMRLSAYNSTAVLATLQIPGGYPGHPEWSGDGQHIAFSWRQEANGYVFTNSTLWITDVDLNGPSFSGAHQIVANDSMWPTVTYPSFSPDSQWIAFQRATQAIRPASGRLWLTSQDGQTQMALDAATGVGTLPSGQDAASFEPHFLPVSVGGYFWLVFVSERQYGNTLEDTSPNTRMKQLWVTAIDASPQPGVDPSHPAFWLPGQRLDRQNMRGQWSLSPCKQIGESCDAGFECCEGFCQQNDDGEWVCDDSSAGGCSAINEACTTAADCCDPGAECIFGFCALKDPR
jgi:WD40 repeat protein